MEWPPKLREEIEKKLQEGEQRIFAQFMFIVEEPEECADFETGPMRFPFFTRLAWSPKKNMWRLVEIFASNDAQFSSVCIQGPIVRPYPCGRFFGDHRRWT